MKTRPIAVPLPGAVADPLRAASFRFGGPVSAGSGIVARLLASSPRPVPAIFSSGKSPLMRCWSTASSDSSRRRDSEERAEEAVQSPLAAPLLAPRGGQDDLALACAPPSVDACNPAIRRRLKSGHRGITTPDGRSRVRSQLGDSRSHGSLAASRRRGSSPQVGDCAGPLRSDEVATVIYISHY